MSTVPPDPIARLELIGVDKRGRAGDLWGPASAARQEGIRCRPLESLRCQAPRPPESRGSRAGPVWDRGLSRTLALLRLAAQVALNLGVERGRVFDIAIDSLVGVVVGRQTGDAPVDDHFISYGLPDLAAVAVGLRFGLVLLPLDLVRGLGRVVFHGDLLLLGQFASHLLKLFDAGKLVNV